MKVNQICLFREGKTKKKDTDDATSYKNKQTESQTQIGSAGLLSGQLPQYFVFVLFSEVEGALIKSVVQREWFMVYGLCF